MHSYQATVHKDSDDSLMMLSSIASMAGLLMKQPYFAVLGLLFALMGFATRRRDFSWAQFVVAIMSAITVIALPTLHQAMSKRAEGSQAPSPIPIEL